MFRRLIAVVGTAAFLVAFVAAATPASAHVGSSKIRPHQHFTGLVNGTASNATVKVFCPGPVTLHQEGHPMTGQKLKVKSPPALPLKAGYTGTAAHKITASLAPTPSAAGRVVFIRYGVKKPIPIKVLVPCSGKGVVTFTPRPWSPTAKSYHVSVTFQRVVCVGRICPL